MAEVSGGAIRLIDRDGDPLDDGNGKLNINATLEAASVNIGDVDILTVPAPLNLTGGGTESSALRVTLANDSTGVLSIDDNGGSLTIDGTVTANLGATDNAVLDTIYTNTLVSASSVYAEDVAHTSADKGMHILAVRRDVPITGSGNDGDYSTLNISAQGGLYVEEIIHGVIDTFAMIDVDNSAELLSDTIGIFTDCAEIMLQADEDNSGYVIVGDSDVADNRGMKLSPGDTIILDIDDTRIPYLWGSAANQNVRCMLKRRIT